MHGHFLLRRWGENVDIHVYFFCNMLQGSFSVLIFSFNTSLARYLLNFNNTPHSIQVHLSSVLLDANITKLHLHTSWI